MMNILIFTEGTVLMHGGARGQMRKEVVGQVKSGEGSVHDYGSYISIAGAPDKIKKWITVGHGVSYLTSRRRPEDIQAIQHTLDRNGFPHGALYFRAGDQSYAEVVEEVKPDVLIEDDCESIGGEGEMIYTKIKPEVRNQIKHIVTKEFEGINSIEI